MDPLLLLQNAEEEPTEDSEDLKKAKKQKKMTPAMVRKMQAKMAEEVRLQLLKQRQEYLRETKLRVQNEWDAHHAKAEIYEAEFQLRQAEFEKAFKILSNIDNFWDQCQKKNKKDEEWQQYVCGGKLPIPSSLPEMNTYIYVWTEIEKNNQMPYCLEKTEEVMKLLNGLEALINYPYSECSPKSLEDMKELRCKMRNLLQDNIDRATFYLFSRIETEMVSINLTTSKYSAKCSHFLMSLWAELITPIPSTRGKEVRYPLKVHFEETDVVVIFPISLLDIHKVIRCMWLYYDHWSDRCRTFYCPPPPEYYKQNMFELFLGGNNIKLDIMSYRDKLEITKKKKIAAMPPEPSLSLEIMAWDSEPQKSLSEEVSFREFEEEDQMGRAVKAFLDENEVNLRERTILGDLLLVNVIHQPPQPKCLRFKHCVTLRQEASKLNEVDFYVKFILPEPEEPKPGEEAESRRATKKMTSSKMEENAEKKKLIHIQLKPCKRVVWFEAPLVAHWNPIHEYWSTEDIYDVEMDEDDGTITFKSGRLGLFGLHVNRYCNLPYENWLFEPDEENGINFYLKTPKVELHFKIREGEVCLYYGKAMPNRALNPLFEVYYPPAKLMEALKEKGLDVFPAPDAAAYLDEIQSKNFVVEKTIYEVWGLFSQSHRFKHSKFSQLAGRGNIVFQAQEIYAGHQVDYCLIQCSACSCCILDINEDSNAYSSEPASDELRAIEPYGLLYNNSTLKARRLTEVTSYLLVATVKEFLSLVRPLSFSCKVN